MGDVSPKIPLDVAEGALKELARQSHGPDVGAVYQALLDVVRIQTGYGLEGDGPLFVRAVRAARAGDVAPRDREVRRLVRMAARLEQEILDAAKGRMDDEQLCDAEADLMTVRMWVGETEQEYLAARTKAEAAPGDGFGTLFTAW